MKDSVTVQQVAQKAQVSVGTVSRVFNQHSNVTDELRKRVITAASDLGYTRQMGQGSPQNGTRVVKEIGFLYCSIVDHYGATSNPFWSHILAGVEQEARKTKAKVTYRAIGDLVQSPQALATTIEEMKLGGILLVGPAEVETIHHLKALNLPLVLVDNYVPELSIDSVLCDNFEGARLAVNHLIQQGHQRIAFIGGPLVDTAHPTNTIYTLERRSAGYRIALLDAGLPVDYALFESSGLYPESGYEACQRLLKSGAQFTAVFCANDEVAIGVMRALHQAKKRVPEEVSLVGFDDIALVEHLTPALTTMRVNKEAMGAIAVRRLLQRAAEPDMISTSSMLEVELIKRDSVSRYHA